MKLCIKCGREMKRTLLMNAVSKEFFQKYNCIECGVEIWEKESANNEQNNEQAETDDDWISVKDRLPDEKERYLICTENRRIYIAYYQLLGDKFSNHEPFWQGSSCRFTSVTHWQPLPELPKGE